MTVCSAPDEDPRNPIHYYCNRCNKEKYDYPERHKKWDEEPCLACGEPLPRGGGMPFKAAFNRALKRLQHYPHNEDKLYNTAQTKVREKTTKEIQCWKESAEVADKVTSYNILVKKEISIQRGVIDFRYTGNLMVLLQNNSEKPYTIESKEKITQAIFLPLAKIGKFVPVENCEELLQTTRGTFGFGSTGKRIEANFAETIEEKGKVIKTEQFITLLSYGKSEIRIKRTIKEKDLIFEPYSKTCQQFLIGLTNFFIPADKAQ
ncbi:hypothetical protein G9A89_018868 [Geosiphon pyriformis]|nr:hypothetical protein G9A89_018868 [Geosiphon pyriformis]